MEKVSKRMMERLPVYLTYLRSLPDDAVNISATSISVALNMGEVQVRKDLARVSEAGRPKRGYPRKTLLKDIENFLCFSTRTKAVIVGAGKLGCALLDYTGFAEYGLDIVAAFDIRNSTEYSSAEKPIYHICTLPSFCKRHENLIGIITVPAECAQDVCDLLVSCGIQAIWNFAPTHLNVPEHVIVENENLAISLAALRLHPIIKKNGK